MGKVDIERDKRLREGYQETKGLLIKKKKKAKTHHNEPGRSGVKIYCH